MEVLRVHDEGEARILTLNRPEVRNALSRELRMSLSRQLEATRGEPSVRAVVITGAESTFSAGLDLSELKALAMRSSEQNREDSAQLAELYSTVYTFPKPVIAAVNGHAVGGGAGLATVCDFVVMDEAAKFGYTESRIGFVPALVGVFLSRQVGERIARRLLLSGELVSSSEALAMGVIDEVCPANRVVPRALDRAREMLKNAPGSLSMTKQLLANVRGMGLREGLGYAVELNALARTSDDFREGIRAFLEKREPLWNR